MSQMPNGLFSLADDEIKRLREENEALKAKLLECSLLVAKLRKGLPKKVGRPRKRQNDNQLFKMLSRIARHYGIHGSHGWITQTMRRAHRDELVGNGHSLANAERHLRSAEFKSELKTYLNRFSAIRKSRKLTNISGNK